MIKVVVDTNIFVSAILFGGNCEKILNLAEENRIKLVTSPDILKELKEVLQKKFKKDFIIFPSSVLTVISHLAFQSFIREL